MEVTGKHIHLTVRKSPVQASRAYTPKLKATPLLASPVEEFATVSAEFVREDETQLTKKEKFMIFLSRKKFWRDKSSTIGSRDSEEKNGGRSSEDDSLPCKSSAEMTHDLHQESCRNDNSEANKNGRLYDRSNCCTTANLEDATEEPKNNLELKRFLEVNLNTDMQMSNSSSSASSMNSLAAETTDTLMSDLATMENKSAVTPANNIHKRLEGHKCEVLKVNASSQTEDPVITSSFSRSPSNDRKIQQMSKAKRISELEIDMRNILKHPQTVSGNSERTKELNKQLTARRLQTACEDALAPCRQKLTEALQMKEELAVKNCELQQRLDKLESILQDERTEAEEEKRKRKNAETELMLASVEAGALRRKLSILIKGGPEMDPHLLQIAFRKCREELDRRTQRLREVELRYKQVVPKVELERCQKRIVVLSHANEKLTSAHEQLKLKLEELVQSHESACVERDELRMENESLRRSATPRPDWNKVAEHVEGGIGRWHEMSLGRTSEQLLDVVLAELTGSASAYSAEFLSCQGTDANVPAFLRYDGCVRNKRLGKRDVLLIIQDIWKERKRCLSNCTMADYVDQYFRERYHLEEVRAEWCYSLVDACQRLAHEEQIGLFWGILCSQVQEQVYHHQEETVARLYQAFLEKDTDKKGFISKEAADLLLEGHFPLKGAMFLDELRSLVYRAASVRAPDVIKYRPLFIQEDSKFATGARLPLAKVLVRQVREEQEEYVAEVLREIKPSAVDVSVGELRRAFTVVDPHIEQRQLDSYISWVFGVHPTNLSSCKPIPLALLVARLQTGLIVRIGKKN